MRASFEQTLSDAVSDAIGVRVKLHDQGRTQDGRLCFDRPQKSLCLACAVSYLKDHVNAETDIPCERNKRKYCRTHQLAQALAAFESAKAVEARIEAALRQKGISADVSLGRGNAHNMSINVKVDPADRARFQAEKRKALHERKLSSGLAEALNILSPTTPGRPQGTP